MKDPQPPMHRRAIVEKYKSEKHANIMPTCTECVGVSW